MHGHTEQVHRAWLTIENACMPLFGRQAAIWVGKNEDRQEGFEPMRTKGRRGGEKRAAITVGQECSKWSREDRIAAVIGS
jgi:hypothetical protein